MGKPLPLDEQLCFSLYAASMAVSRMYKPLLDGLGITYPQYLVLNVLWENKRCSVGEIAERLSLEPSTVTPLLKRLEAAGLAVRERDSQDERRVRASLTEHGMALQADCGRLNALLAESSGMSGPELAELNSLVTQLRSMVSRRPRST